MKVLMVSSEAIPYAKTGGLADAVSTLTSALRHRGVDVRLMIPEYGEVAGATPVGSPVEIPSGTMTETAEFLEDRGGDYPVYLLRNPGFFRRKGIYDDPDTGAFFDNSQRFAFFSRAAFALCRELNWIPDVFHAHDWPAALVPVYLRSLEAQPPFDRSASLFTIHNLGYQGAFPIDEAVFTNLSPDRYQTLGLKQFNTLNYMQGAIHTADVITTVSPTYAREIQTREYGHGQEENLHRRQGDVHGILNGMDYSVWNPSADPYLPEPFDADSLEKKAVSKTALQRLTRLPEKSDTPVFGIVSRLAHQKGFDELVAPEYGILPRILRDMELQVVVLGTGDKRYEKRLMELHAQYPNFRAILKFDEKTAHLIEAGSDFFLMPSRYEPCGLNQMYSLRYGTLPIVRRTGGLADTVESYNEHTGEGTGFVFNDLRPQVIYDVVGWATWAYYNKPDHIETMRKRAMAQRFSWDDSARGYEELYEKAAEKQRA